MGVDFVDIWFVEIRCCAVGLDVSISPRARYVLMLRCFVRCVACVCADIPTEVLHVFVLILTSWYVFCFPPGTVCVDVLMRR